MDHRKPAALLLKIAGAAALTGLYVAALTRYNALGHYPLYFAKGLYVYIVVYISILAAATKAYGGYEMEVYRAPETAFSQMLSLTFVNLITYLQISLIAKEFLRADYLLMTTAAQYVFIFIWTLISYKIYYTAFKPGRMALVYSGDRPDALIEKAGRSRHRFNLAAFLNEGETMEAIEKGELGNFDGIMFCGDGGRFGAYIRKHCFERNIRLYIIPEIADILLHGSGLTGLFDTPLLVCKNDSMTSGQAYLKRLLDIVGSLAILALLSPLMLVTALAIKAGDGGPVFYFQERLTGRGELFKVCKFRSMVDGAEKDGRARLARKNDGRITPVGRIIRKLRIDEIPQFFNVLTGSMSIVGPRPERPEIAAKYSAELPEFGYRLKMKAGITGYAQVYGKYNTTPRDKLMMDIIYINNYSILLDIRLILLTIKIVFLPEKTEGF